MRLPTLIAHHGIAEAIDSGQPVDVVTRQTTETLKRVDESNGR